MNSFNKFAFLLLAVSAAGCQQQAAVEKAATEIAALNQKVTSLSQDLQTAQQQATQLQTRVTVLELWRTVDKEMTTQLDPASKSYGVVKTNLGNLLVSVDDLSPYGDGYKLKLMVGNPNMATFDGAKIKVQWAEKPRWGEKDFDGQKWNASIHSKEMDVVNVLQPGAWNPIEVIISPANAAQTGYLTVEATLDKLSLRRTN